MARNILITGSSHGIGAGCAVAFARDEGANIGICGNKCPEGAEEVARQCEAYGVKTKIYLGNVGDHDFCKATMEDFIATFGKIDVLVNNAGGALQIPGGPKGEFKDMPMEYWDSQIALNLNSAAYLSRYAVADMIEKKTEGRIVNISSIHGQVTWVHRRMLPYSAGKAGLNMFTKALGVEVAKYGIRVNCVAPGLIFTKVIARYSKADLEAFSHKIPVGRGGSVEEIVPTVQFLADIEKTRFIVGQVICVDGGQSADGTIESMNFPLYQG
ncbi:MAG: SDR family oxidoreductase [Bacteroidales bacterium]|jgi:NAD(P)-dependent dehydrogenase (short-subunit alcohol dehydrogenase family)|nr:SDR family oxidoreductase [Bacteroidales bacterium]